MAQKKTKLKTIKPAEADIGSRVDKFLQKELAEYSRTDIQKLLIADKVLLDGEPVAKNLRVEAGMEFTLLATPEKEASDLAPEKIPLDIVFEDKDVVVLNKPRGLVVHPGNGIAKGTLAAGLLYHFGEKHLSKINGPLRPGIVHRLDKDTCGLMVVAKTDAAHRSLAHQLETRDLHRVYHALIWGHPRDLEGVVDAPLGRDPKNRLKIAVLKNGKAARTHYKALEFFEFATLMEFQLETGRTHQIRVHSRFTGHPVFGDPTYEGRESGLVRVQPLWKDVAAKALEMSPAQLLQAVQISFIHPKTGKRLTFKAPADPAFSKVLRYLRKECPCDSPVFDEDSSAFRDFATMQQFAEPVAEDIDESELYPYEETPIKDRPTRAEHLQKKLARRARKKELELEKHRKQEARRAERTGETPADVTLPGHEPTIDPNLLG